MKQSIIIIVLSLIICGLGFGVYHQWKNADMYKDMWEQSNGLANEKDKEYQTTKKQMVDDIERLVKANKQLDRLLQINIKKVKEFEIHTATGESSGGGRSEGKGKTIYVEVPIKVTDSSNNVTTITQLSERYEWSDYHLALTFTTTDQSFKYKLTQKFKIQSYDLGDEVQVEMAEIDDKGEVRNVYKVSTVAFKETPKNEWYTGFNLNIGGGGTLGTNLKLDYSVHALVNFLSRGKSHLDSDWRLLSVGAGYPGFVFSPVQYRISNHIPLLSDLYGDLLIVLPYRALSTPYFGIGISSTF